MTQENPTPTPPARPSVFISYAHETDDHKQKVYGLAASLDRDGFEIVIDIEKKDGHDWPTWMQNPAIAVVPLHTNVEIGMQIGPTSARNTDPPGKLFDHGELCGISLHCFLRPRSWLQAGTRLAVSHWRTPGRSSDAERTFVTDFR